MYHMIVKLFQDSDRVENKIFGGEESSNWETSVFEVYVGIEIIILYDKKDVGERGSKLKLKS